MSSKTVNFDIAGYEEFRQRCRNGELSDNQKAGFPDSYRADRSELILADIDSKIPSFARHGARVLDIGVGCSDLSHAIVSRAIRRTQNLALVDSAEMLSQLEYNQMVSKIEGPFPACLNQLMEIGPFDAILVYSVVQYVFAEASLNRFVDSALMLLAEENAGLLIGDIPNTSMRKRFFDSAAGGRYHSEHYANHQAPEIRFNVPEPGQIDDAVVLGVLARARAAGFQAFVVPQGEALPMANRREDILIRRP